MLTVIRMLEQNSYDSISGLTVIEADPRICSGSQHTLIKPNRFLRRSPPFLHVTHVERVDAVGHQLVEAREAGGTRLARTHTNRRPRRSGRRLQLVRKSSQETREMRRYTDQ